MQNFFQIVLKIKCQALIALGLLLPLLQLEQCETEEYDYRAYYSRYTSTEQIGTIPVNFAIAVPNFYYSNPRPMPLILAIALWGDSNRFKWIVDFSRVSFASFGGVGCHFRSARQSRPH